MGLTEVNLVVRESDFPYEPHLLSIGPAGDMLKGKRLLKNDPIQLWVQAQAALN